MITIPKEHRDKRLILLYSAGRSTGPLVRFLLEDPRNFVILNYTLENGMTRVQNNILQFLPEEMFFFLKNILQRMIKTC